MIRLLLVITFLFLVHSVSAQNKVAWSETKPLTWEQFKPRKNPGFGFRALTFSGIGYDVKTVDGMVEVEVNCYFIPEKSWVQKGFENPYLLAHEQLHFDITEIFARKMRMEMQSFEMPVGEFIDNNSQDALEKLYDDLYEDMVRMQEQYDKETDHSLNREAQTEWVQKVAQLLEETEEYSSD